MLYACDLPWWDHYFAHVATTFRGELWTVSDGACRKYGLAWLLGVDQAGLSRDPTLIHTGKNSGYQAIGLAHNFGAARMVLLGYDFQLGLKGERHHHGNHPKGCGQGCQNFGPWRNAMAALAADLAGTSTEVLNASRRTALRCFPRVTLETALNEF